MSWFRRQRIGTKLMIGFSCMIFLVGAIGFTGYRSIKKIQHNLEDVFTVTMPSIANLIETDRDYYRMLVAERSMIFANTKSDVFKELVKEYESGLKQSEERWQLYRTHVTAAEEKAVIEQYGKARDESKSISRRIVDGRVADTRKGRREALDLSLGLAKQKFQKMQDHLNKLIEMNLENARAANQASSATYKKPIIIRDVQIHNF